MTAIDATRSRLDAAISIYGFSFDTVTQRWVVCKMERVDGRMQPTADIESFPANQRRACERRTYELNCEVSRARGHMEPAPFRAGRG